MGNRDLRLKDLARDHATNREGEQRAAARAAARHVVATVPEAEWHEALTELLEALDVVPYLAGARVTSEGRRVPLNEKQKRAREEST